MNDDRQPPSVLLKEQPLARPLKLFVKILELEPLKSQPHVTVSVGAGRRTFAIKLLDVLLLLLVGGSLLIMIMGILLFVWFALFGSSIDWPANVLAERKVLAMNDDRRPLAPLPPHVLGNSPIAARPAASAIQLEEAKVPDRLKGSEGRIPPATLLSKSAVLLSWTGVICAVAAAVVLCTASQFAHLIGLKAATLFYGLMSVSFLSSLLALLLEQRFNTPWVKRRVAATIIVLIIISGLIVVNLYVMYTD